MIAHPNKGGFDVVHLKAIHSYISQDVYEWAGQFRTINISKNGHLLGAAAFVEQSLFDVFRRLASEHHLTGTSLDTFIDRSASYFGEINAAHPFREGKATRKCRIPQ